MRPWKKPEVAVLDVSKTATGLIYATVETIVGSPNQGPQDSQGNCNPLFVGPPPIANPGCVPTNP